ncbi:MAG: transglycosylase domain-containing protein [Chloroflexi bacterium]|nr:transglycosylase domain-containing protein [Chloroflexota bacterium]
MNTPRKADPPKSVPQRHGYVSPESAPGTPQPSKTPEPAPAYKKTPATSIPPPRIPRKAPPRSPRTGCAARAFLAFALVVFGGFFALLAVGAGAWIVISSQVPDVSTLRERQSNFASTRIYDAHGALLLELTDPDNPAAGIRQRVRLDEISPFVRQATLATEDPNFYRYQVGFDPIAIVRLLYYAWQEREFVSGGSTITQQVARNLLLDPEERTQRTLSRKIREIVLANEIARRYSRDEILEIYLNEIFYSNQAYGIEAAARTYFGKRAKDLTLAEASLLAGIPQSPVLWDPVAHKDNALRRQADVLRLMAQAGFITQDQIAPAQRDMQAREFHAPQLNVPPVAPHFLYYVRTQLDREYGAQGLFRAGLNVYTSLDLDAQRAAEDAVRTRLAELQDKNVTNASVVVLRPDTGEIVAMVGSAGFDNTAIDGQVNVAITAQQPGSSIKPFTYLAALERGATPATLFWDVPKKYRDAWGNEYEPRNYDGKFHGAMLMRDVLARSMNIPAVEALDFVGVPAFLEITSRVGVNFPPNPQYGLAITLGGAECTLLDLTRAYAVLADGGRRREPTAITRVETLDGQLVRDYRQTPAAQVVRPEHAYLITHMLADNAARAPSFGVNNPLKLPFPAAAKTGTTNDYRDNLTVGYSTQYVVGVWVGNTDNSAMRNVSGISGAAPIWRDVMLALHASAPPPDFTRPAGVVEAEVCALGGRLPSPACPQKRREVFAADQPPLPVDERVERAAAAGDPALAEAPLPPTAAPQLLDMAITQPANGASVARGLLSVRGTVNPAGFQSYQVEYGVGDNPGDWLWISGPHLSPVVDDQLTQWSLDSLAPGRYTLRVTAFTASGQVVAYARFDVM